MKGYAYLLFFCGFYTITTNASEEEKKVSKRSWMRVKHTKRSMRIDPSDTKAAPKNLEQLKQIIALRVQEQKEREEDKL